MKRKLAGFVEDVSFGLLAVFLFNCAAWLVIILALSYAADLVWRWMR